MVGTVALTEQILCSFVCQQLPLNTMPIPSVSSALLMASTVATH